MLVLAASLSGVSIHPRARLHHLGEVMKTLAGLLLSTMLAMNAGCARTDWIDRTLVTVDVMGTWQSTTALWELNLVQEGQKVTGDIRHGGLESSVGAYSGPIEGTVAGDVLSFRGKAGGITSEMKVSGDEMFGTLTVNARRVVTLQRVGSPSRPASPPR
jgi:hypothetical protein